MEEKTELRSKHRIQEWKVSETFKCSAEEVMLTKKRG
jgi:hypothetical protein